MTVDVKTGSEWQEDNQSNRNQHKLCIVSCFGRTNPNARVNFIVHEGFELIDPVFSHNSTGRLVVML